jgi:hypothetical protein
MRGHQVPVKVEQLPDCSGEIKSEYEQEHNNIKL